MPRDLKPMEDDELAGLVMAVTAEAQRAGWDVRYRVQGDGSLVLHMHHSRKEFSMVKTDDGSRGRLVIGLSTSSAEVTAGDE